MIHQSKLPNLETTIFAVMSAMAFKYKAINLSQGYPNFKSDEILINLVHKAMHSGYNQYAAMQGVFEFLINLKNFITHPIILKMKLQLQLVLHKQSTQP